MLILSGKIEIALRRVLKALRLAEQHIYIEGHTDLYNELIQFLRFHGVIEYFRSNYAKAENILNNCLDVCSKHGILVGITDSYIMVVNIHVFKAKICSETGRAAEAEALFQKALDMVEPMDQANPIIIQTRSFIHVEHADCLKNQKLYPQALELYRLAQLVTRNLIKKHRQSTDKKDLARAMAGEAICLYLQDDREQAARLASKALRLLKMEYQRTRIPSIKNYMNELLAVEAANS